MSVYLHHTGFQGKTGEWSLTYEMADMLIENLSDRDAEEMVARVTFWPDPRAGENIRTRYKIAF